jgi:hypothetical protein
MCSTFQEYKVMISRAVLTFIAICSFAASAAFFFGVNDEINATSVVGQPASYIVQGKSADSVAAIVQSVGGDITHELGVIRAVGATLTPAQAEALRLHSDVQRLYGNGSIEVAASRKPITRREYSPTACMSPASMAAVSVSQCWIPGFGITMASSTIQPVMRA